ncbi:MAG: F0F1 ATP synthase subunit epsilon [Vicinamibacteraceae bacterium]|nr:F0F1 ATP synthase subunit epsilon [Vicinamibacteraceae bacterium]
MALPSKLSLELVTPDRALAHEAVDEVQLPGVDGYIGVLPGHTPLLALLGVGQMWYRRGTEKTFLSVAGGTVEVLPDRVIVLSLTAERAEDIDIMRAEAARKRAEQALVKSARIEDVELARIALLRAISRLNTASKARTRG